MSALETTAQDSARPRKLAELLDELVRAAEAGDRARFDAAFDACLSRVYAVASSVAPDRSGAEQVTASVLLRAVERASRPAHL